MTTKLSPTSQMQSLSAYAVRVAAEKFGKSLDYSDKSLSDLESLLQQASEAYLLPETGKSLTEEALRNTANVWGSYLGEYMRRKWGGKWIIHGTDFILRINEKNHLPIHQVYRRITHGKQYDLKEYIYTIAADIAKPKLIQLSSIKSAGNSLIETLIGFWRSGPAAKVVSAVTTLVVLFCICLGSILLIPSPGINPIASNTPLLPDNGVHTSTSTVISSASHTQAPPVALPFTVTFNPSLAASFTPSLTATFTPISTATLTPLAQSPLRVHFVDVGQGDSILIQTPYGQTVLIDGGDTNTGIIQYLQSLGIQRIDLMVATHPNADHIGGLVQVLQTFPVVKVVTNGQLATTNVYENFLDAIMSAGAQYSDIKHGDVLSAGGIDFICLNPVDITNPDTNENSIVLLFSYGPTKFLLMGDAGAATEANLVASNLLSRVDILKVGHHGSTTGTTSAFLSVIKPVVAIYSAALNNSYGHPAPQTISALQVVGATIYGTDRNGTIIISADLNGYTAKLARLTPITTSTLAKLTPTYTSTRATTTPGSVTLTILSVTSPVSKGSNATLSARTSPNASCSIVVSYKSGPSHASGLGSKIADSSGAVSWTWKVGSGTTSGTWPISVTCNDITQTTSFIVR